MEEIIAPALTVPQAHFVLSSKIDYITSCDIGFFHLGQYLPSQVLLSLNSVKTVGEQQVVTARISLGILQGKEEVVENWKRFLEIIVGRDKETIDFKLSEDNSNTLNLEFVAKCEGRYSVSVICMGRVLGVAQWWWRSLVVLSVLGMMTTYKENMIRDTLKVAPLGSPNIKLLTVYYSQELSQVFLVSLFMIAWY